MTVAFGKLGKECRVELERRARIDGVDAVLFIDRLAQHDRPALVPLLEKIVEATRAQHVAGDAVHLGPLRNGHLGLRNRTRLGDIDRRAAEKVQDADIFVPTFTTYFDEALGGSLEPRCHHAPFRMPDGAEAFPISRVAP